MGAEPFILPAEAPAPPDDPVRLGWALGFVAFGLAIAGAVLTYMLPLSVEAQWGHPVATAEVTRVLRGAEPDDRSSYAVAWTTPAGERLTGTVSPLLAELRVRQTIAVRYAGSRTVRRTSSWTRRWKSGVPGGRAHRRGGHARPPGREPAPPAGQSSARTRTDTGQ